MTIDDCSMQSAYDVASKNINRQLSFIHQAFGIVYGQMGTQVQSFSTSNSSQTQANQQTARTHLNKAIELSPDIMQNWVYLALLEMKTGRSDHCMQICERILSMDPNNDNAYEMKGDLYKTSY
jgi:tetratricopeptide (TPR) repeat protein